MKNLTAYKIMFITLLLMGLGWYPGYAMQEESGTQDPTMPSPFRDRLTIESQTSPVTVSMRGVSAVDAKVCWASGPDGTVLRTINAGKTWQSCSVTAAPGIDFRDIHAFDAQTAVVMGIASPAVFYRTTDGGQTWYETYRNQDPAVFFDGMGFWDDGQRGLAFSDPVDGKIFIIQTNDAGKSWTEINSKNIPTAFEGEAGFAGSGTGIVTYGNGHAMIGLGGKTPKALARILRSADYGQTWSATFAPLAASESAGIFSIALNDENQGVAVGGDYLKPDVVNSVSMVIEGGVKFRAKRIDENGPSGYRSVVAFIPGSHALVAAGPNGIDLTENPNANWQRVSATGFHSLSFAQQTTQDGLAVGWLVGSEGRIARITIKE